MNGGDGQPIIKNEDWNFIEQCMHKMVNSVEHRPEPINETELRKLEGTIGGLRSQRPLLRIACQHFFYEKCKLFIEQYITSEVLPSFRGKRDESLLGQFVDRWEKHNRIAKMLNDVFYRPIWGRSMPPLDEVGLTLFRDMFDDVYFFRMISLDFMDDVFSYITSYMQK
ncbi:cullin-1-like [Syzygium oleosum]|uniref:cullin-1-like n=1 Tax=Syzygium oleosum TaxID=219896 RepID=UPI0011D1C041|nr:cullin-1-like [Syzygium oleosum]